MESVVLKSYLEYFCRGIGGVYVWRPRFCVLRGKSANQSLRFDCYADEDTFETDPLSCKPLKLTDSTRVALCSIEDRDHTFELITSEADTRHVYCAKDMALLQSWFGTLQQVLNKHHPAFNSSLSLVDDTMLEQSTECVQYPADVVSTKASEHCNLIGTYSVRINALNITLMQNNSILYIWPYRYIRRYGRSRSTFTFEAGRKCQSGEGLFTFKVENGIGIFNCVQQRTKAMKEHVVDSPQPRKSTDDDSGCWGNTIAGLKSPIRFDSDDDVDSGFNTMEVDVNPLVSMKTVAENDSIGKASTMAQLVVEMNKAQASHKADALSRDNYDHVDLRRDAERQLSVEKDITNIYGELTLNRSNYVNSPSDSAYCEAKPPITEQKPSVNLEKFNLRMKPMAMKKKGSKKK